MNENERLEVVRYVFNARPTMDEFLAKYSDYGVYVSELSEVLETIDEEHWASAVLDIAAEPLSGWWRDDHFPLLITYCVFSLNCAGYKRLPESALIDPEENSTATEHSTRINLSFNMFIPSIILVGLTKALLHGRTPFQSLYTRCYDHAPELLSILKDCESFWDDMAASDYGAVIFTEFALNVARTKNVVAQDAFFCNIPNNFFRKMLKLPEGENLVYIYSKYSNNEEIVKGLL